MRKANTWKAGLKPELTVNAYLLAIISILFTMVASVKDLPAQYVQVFHKPPSVNEIPVSTAGCLDKPGSSYILVNDISSPRGAFFLGKDVTLDLNGYTITYTDGNYEHVKNYGFEEGLAGWDISRAPGAKVVNTADEHPFIGQKILRLAAGDEITSSYISLPVADRSYYAICGVTGRYYHEMNGDMNNDMRVSIFVEDSNGKEVTCVTRYRDTLIVSCPVLNRSARLGGGFVFAHLNNLPAGRYRIKVRAETDCLVDEIDIRPSMDAGIGIVETTHPLGHYDHLYSNLHSAFFDYSDGSRSGTPVTGVPVVKGKGKIIIRNGTIRNATESVLSWGIQSTARDITLILDNLQIISSGINSTAVDARQAVITNCRFEVDNPFIINRHGSEFYAVDLTGENASQVSFSEFLGGQGCLCIKGQKSLIHDNMFVNRQTVTNHYSIMAMGDSSRIYNNIFKPEIGSGVEIFRNKYIQIYDNKFYITAAPPSCEYDDLLSTNAIRLADYGAEVGAANGCFGNRIFNNQFYITGKKYTAYPDFIPLASAIFYSASAGENEISGNEIFVHQEDPGSDAEALAFYIGNARGGIFSNNTIISNVTPVWIGSPYGNAELTVISGNTFLKEENSNNPFLPIRIGPGNLAKEIGFRSNEFRGLNFGVESSSLKPHSYTVFWTLKIKAADNIKKRDWKKGIIVFDVNGKEAFRTSGSLENNIDLELPEYSWENGIVSGNSPYIIIAGRRKYKVDLNQNTEVLIGK